MQTVNMEIQFAHGLHPRTRITSGQAQSRTAFSPQGLPTGSLYMLLPRFSNLYHQLQSHSSSDFLIYYNFFKTNFFLFSLFIAFYGIEDGRVKVHKQWQCYPAWRPVLGKFSLLSCGGGLSCYPYYSTGHDEGSLSFHFHFHLSSYLHTLLRFIDHISSDLFTILPIFSHHTPAYMLFLPRFINLTPGRASRERHLTMCFLSRRESVQSFGTICQYFPLFIVPLIFLPFLLPCIFLEGMSVPSLWELYLCPQNIWDHILNIWTPEPDASPAGDLVLWFPVFVIYLYISAGWEAWNIFNDTYTPN